MAWPAFEPELARRLAMGDAEYDAFITGLLGSLAPRPYDDAVLERALAYPWERPARSYVLRGGRAALLDELPEPERAALLEPTRGRLALLAFGSNGAPDTLVRKFAGLPEGERDVLVLAGELHDVDVGAVSHPTTYGSMAATLFASPGTAVRAAVLLVTTRQLAQLTWTEISYRLGTLDVPFVPDQPTPPITGALAYVARWGCFAPDGAPPALAAIPATGRRAPALTQRELLERAAALALGPGTSAETLVRHLFADMPGFFASGASARVRAAAQPFVSAAWRPFAPEG